MDASSLEELIFNPSKCSKLSMERKRELVYEVSNWSDSAADILHTWSRQDILQILCAELGKERKYTGLTKTKIIEHLLKVVYEKKSQEGGTPNVSEAQLTSGSTVYCKNSACKANLNREDVFCKRCSCCICHQYDDNKDPSLWLICSSDPPFHGMSCGMSCHLECALRHENSGISRDREDKGLDGSFRCVSCGKVNDLLGSWRKQVVVARDTRRVDILCYRLSLCQKILAGTKDYQNLCEYVDEAVLKLEEDVGPLTGLPVKKARGIVNRLSSGLEIQRLCASAVESLDLMLSERVPSAPSDCNMRAINLVQIEEVHASSIRVALDDSKTGNVVCCTLWHRKADDKDYPAEPTCRLSTPDTKFILSNLTPSTEYFLKVIILDKDRETGLHEFQFRTEGSEEKTLNMNPKSSEEERSQSPATNCSSLSNPSSVEDENNNADKTEGKETNGDIISLSDEEHSRGKVNKETIKGPVVEEASTGNGSNTPRTGLECVPFVDSLQITPCKKENEKEGDGRKNRRKRYSGKAVDDLTKKDEEPQAGSSSKKRSDERREEGNTGIGDKDFEYYVKVIRWLECDGHIETTFRQKFLTWYSLRATPQEVRIVKVFIDTFIEDPDSLAEQLVDTFSDVISNKRCCTVPSGFCLKLWH